MDQNRIYFLLVQIYGEQVGSTVFNRLDSVLEKYRRLIPKPHTPKLTQRDAILITYADQVREADRPTLETLADFCKSHLKDVISGIHILPFYPSSSDDGFSVIDYRAVAPEYGDWKDLQKLGEDFLLMFDAVINHASVGSEWFKGYLNGDGRYRDYFIEVKGTPDLSRVVRPRALPLLSIFQPKDEKKAIWTTFSADQADLNYQNPEVLLEIIDIFLLYISQGAEFIRLDAIAYLWKEIGTTCFHLPQTHWIIQLLRAVLDEIAPQVILITETNVPHADNVSYFGDGTNEAQMVYNFSLPPLVLHAFQIGNAETLSGWASTLQLPSDRVTFFNFLASHDGIGVSPLRGILPEVEIETIVRRVQRGGGLVSFKHNSDGTKSPYELNVNYFDALNDSTISESLDAKVDRFVTAHAILIAFMGMPAIYFHSLFGSQGWPEGVHESGRNRSINRQKFERTELEDELANPMSLRAKIFPRLCALLKARASCVAFDPYGEQRVIKCSPAVFSFLRISPDRQQKVLCLHNVSGESQRIELSLEGMSAQLHDLLTDRSYANDNHIQLTLDPYMSLWLV